MIDRTTWPFVAAKHFTVPSKPRVVKLIVLHTMEAAEKGETAEAVAKFFAKGDRRASAHLCVDNNSVIQCVEDKHIAWGAKGANQNGLHVEMAGSFRQTADQWADAFSQDTLKLTAAVVARLCIDHGLPAVKITTAQLKAGERGIVGHDQVVEAFPDGQVAAEHQDPGKHFPWSLFMNEVWLAIGPTGQ